ncbi:MAG: wax ester/triacylglycerol synthase family O-acyltransferase [bacterium]|nr:wax ester/triacylglycerol synthase family O-acyltransferase [bacterium]MCP5069620.1 wax ester/triacylglycerol synthase family O-acyltransferase [bacterium]
MAETFDRLTQLDNSFLIYEDTQPQSAMHVASTQIHDAQPLRLDDGSLDIERIQEYVLSRLHGIPRYRQRLARTPIEGHPVWIDDASFNIRYHVRHSRLPQPGSERQLKRMVGRIFSQRLDREKPLWELWVIEGLEGDRLAVFSKVHHCMVDGVSGSELISALLTSEPQEKPDPARPWVPRETPSAMTLGIGEVARVVRAPALAANALTRLARDEDDDRHDLGERMRALGRLIGDASGAHALPFNEPVGPHRRLDWTPIPMAAIKEVRRAIGGTVNDIVLAVTAGAVRRYLVHSRGLPLRDQLLRVMAPVSVRRKDERGDLGNRVSAWTLDLPINEPDPLSRLEIICRATAELKETKRALGAEMLTQATEWTGSGLLSLGARLAILGTPFNMVVTNVPGPRVPLFMMESPLLEIHPHVPLMGNLGLGLALFSYDGTLSWGYSADWDLVPDLHELVLATEESFAELRDAAIRG